MRNKAYCAIMDVKNVYITVASPSAYATGMPVMFGGTVEGNDYDTLVHEVSEESQTQFTLHKGSAAFDNDPAFVHGDDKVDGANPNAFFYEQIGKDNYNCYLIDVTKTGGTTVTITPGNAVVSAFAGATKWARGLAENHESPCDNGDWIVLKKANQLRNLAHATPPNGLGHLFGSWYLTPKNTEQKITDYTGASCILSIPRCAISRKSAAELLEICFPLIHQAEILQSDSAMREWEDFYRPAFDAMRQFV